MAGNFAVQNYATAHVRCGVLSVWRVKEIVERMKFMGFHIDIWIGRGWIEKDIVVRGSQDSIMKFKRYMNELAKEVNEYV